MIDWDAMVLAPVMNAFSEDQLPIYTPRGGASFELADAVFDEAYTAVSTNGDGSESTTARPVLGVRLALFAQPPAQGDKVRIPRIGKTFVVSNPEADGHGHAKLLLMEAA